MVEVEREAGGRGSWDWRDSIADKAYMQPTRFYPSLHVKPQTLPRVIPERRTKLGVAPKSKRHVKLNKGGSRPLAQTGLFQEASAVLI